MTNIIIMTDVVLKREGTKNEKDNKIIIKYVVALRFR